MKNLIRSCGLALLAALCSFAAQAQSLTFAEVQATGAKPLAAAEVKALVSGANVDLTLVNGSQRLWKNETDGTFIASRSVGPVKRRSARGTWSVNDDAAYCLAFDWGAMDVDGWCRQLYRVEDRYYAFALTAKPEDQGARYRFSR